MKKVSQVVQPAVNGAESGKCTGENGKEDQAEDQYDLGGQAEAEPDDDQRGECDLRCCLEHYQRPFHHVVEERCLEQAIGKRHAEDRTDE